ncbi:L,D-transpeptidase family protein [Sphingopyxis sp. Geo48]|jgi:murein L,D-transpeptidase YafK|uniref:L,D-transpeptidase family protein n=1 Tax=Sphingopyxis sp. Geo48 TaxID=545241 RepID=UPI0024B7A1B4|nr:L,D-transpeptidase family protein [Sphingopyxis sp. Geo48]
MRFAPALLLLLSACGSAQSQPPPAETRIDRLLVDKSERVLIGYAGNREVLRYTRIRLGGSPVGHKRFEGDEKTPEGAYTIDGRNPASAYHLSLRISYPNAADRAYAEARGRSPGGDIFIHGQPNAWRGPAIARDWTDGCIALSNAEIKQLWDIVADGTPITIHP